MPCVLPVLSVKALSLARHAGAARSVMRRHGLAYTAGVLASFAVVAGALIALRGAGEQIGWGFQLQSPLFVTALAYVLFAMALGLSGVVTMGGRIAGVGQGLAARAGYAGSFFTGALAAVAATPCTAPFMGVAVGFAVTQPPATALLVFWALGLGLALPYLALSFVPGWQRRLPRPGPWMERLKQLLAFPLYGSTAWLVWVLGQQAGPRAVARRPRRAGSDRVRGVALRGVPGGAGALATSRHRHRDPRPRCRGGGGSPRRDLAPEGRRCPRCRAGRPRRSPRRGSPSYGPRARRCS